MDGVRTASCNGGLVVWNIRDCTLMCKSARIGNCTDNLRFPVACRHGTAFIAKRGSFVAFALRDAVWRVADNLDPLPTRVAKADPAR